MTKLIRSPKAEDLPYIASTWTRSVLSTHAYQRHGASRTGTQVTKQVDAVLDRQDTKALICVREEDPDRILGWVLYVPRNIPIVHYIYVRKDAPRQRGIASALLGAIGVQPDKGVVCTSSGPSSIVLRRRYPAAVHISLEEFLK